MRRRLMWLVIGLCLGAVAKLATAFVGVPLLFSPPVITMASGAALSTWAAIAAGVGAMAYSVGLTDGSGSVFMNVPVNPSAPQAVPSGWTANSDPSQPPMPPATNPGQTSYCFSAASSVCSPTNTQSGLDSAWLQHLNASSGRSCLDAFGQGSGTTSYNAYPGAGGYYQECGCGFCSGPLARPTDYSQATTCSAGYTGAGGGSCALSDPNAVPYPPDNRCGLKFSGGTMSFDSRDPDCTGAPAGVVSTDGKTVQVTSGGSRVQVQVNTDGSVTVTQWSPTSSGTTQINSVTTGSPSAPGSSTVQSSSQSTTSATGQAAFSQSPSATTSSGSGFPDDYARDATVAAGNVRLGQIDSKLADIKTKLSSDDSKADDPTPRSDSEIQGAFFPGTFDALRGWAMPARAVACPTWSFSVWGHSYTIDAHCTLIEQQRAVMSSICLLVFGIAALFIVLGA